MARKRIQSTKPKLSVKDSHVRVAKITDTRTVTTFTRSRGSEDVSVEVEEGDSYKIGITSSSVPGDLLRQALDAILREDF